MRESFRHELKDLRLDTIRLGEFVAQAVQQVTVALAEADTDVAASVIEADKTIDSLYLDIETRSYELIAVQQPVARDLRLILAVLRVVQDLERSGDLAKNIADMVSSDIEIVKLKPISEIMGRMGVSAKGMLVTAMVAFETQDRAMAAKLDTKDNQIDDLYRQLIKELFGLDKESSLELAISMALTGRYFERIADHAVNIAIWVNYLVTGKMPG